VPTGETVTRDEDLVTFHCRGCGTRIIGSRANVGRGAPCPHCQHWVVVPYGAKRFNREQSADSRMQAAHGEGADVRGISAEGNPASGEADARSGMRGGAWFWAGLAGVAALAAVYLIVQWWMGGL
jgi:hypothetical protein